MSVGTVVVGEFEWTVLSALVTFPLRGIWTIRVEVDADEDDPLPTGPAAFTLAADNEGAPVELVGAILEVDNSTHEGRATALLVGGKGGLASTLLPARTYQQTPFEVPLSTLIADAIEEAGEVLDDDVAVAQQFVPRWHRAGEATAAELLDRLAERYTVTWRMGDAGIVQLAVDEWLDADTEAAGLLIEGLENAHDRTIAGSVARASIRPGVVVRGKRIEEVIYVLDESGLRCMLRWGDGTGAGGLRGDLEAATRRALPPLAYLRTHEVTVRRQLQDGTLDVDADNASIGGVTAVPYYPGVIGCRMVIVEGTRALLAFLGGDETRPAIIGFTRFEQNPFAIENDYPIARANDSVSIGSLTFTAVAGPGGIASIAVTYSPPIGATQVATIIPGTPATINLAGIIQTGSPEVFLRANP